MDVNHENIEKIIRERSWDILLPEEKVILEDNGIDRPLFEKLKSLDEGLIHDYWKEFETMEAGKDTFQFLQNKLREKSKSPSFWDQKIFWVFNYRIPAYIPLAITIVIATIAWYLVNRGQTGAMVSPQKEVIFKTDTLYLASSPDTITVEKIIYINKNEQEISGNEKNRIKDSTGNLENIIDVSDITSKVGLSYSESESIPEFIVSDK